MTGKVFISCGMHPGKETDTALKVKSLLESAKFNLKAYVAITIQSFDDTMTIVKELRLCDYYLLIDFNRPCPSLFTHQEFALAHHLGFGDGIIALREKGSSPPQGFLRYVLSNPAEFDTTDDLLAQVERLVQAKGWRPDHSRNLIVNPLLTHSGDVRYGDHTGLVQHKSWRTQIHNNRPDIPAFGAICILHSILNLSGNAPYRCSDRAYLKWAGHGGSAAYERTVLPQDSETVDVFAVRRDEPGLFLLSTLDVIPRQPIVVPDGDYELTYRVFARDFPLLEFTLIVHLRWQPTPVGAPWTPQTEAEVKEG